MYGRDYSPIPNEYQALQVIYKNGGFNRTDQLMVLNRLMNDEPGTWHYFEILAPIEFTDEHLRSIFSLIRNYYFWHNKLPAQASFKEVIAHEIGLAF
jgi:hypothetical protein